MTLFALTCLCAFLAGYVLRDLIGKACLVGALTRIEQKLGTP